METSVNNKCKAFTSLEQSKKLAEILPFESADMKYYIQQYEDFDTGEIVNNYTLITCSGYFELDDNSYMKILPAWSLAALLDILPDELEDNHFLTLQKEKNEYCCCYEDNNGNSFRHTFADNPVDACYEMILKLHELKML